MKNIDRIKLSNLIYDTILHRQCVLRSGKYLATELYNNGEMELANQLIENCLVHDISKLEDIREFAALASIIDQKKDMQDIKHVLTDTQKSMIELHWENNAHHPEHYNSPNEMPHIFLLEMACDLHARSKQWKTNPVEYLSCQQDIRYHFDNSHYTYLNDHLRMLEEAAIDDGYIDIFNTNIGLLFISQDPVVKHLENFFDTSYLSRIETERLLLDKSPKSDFSSIIYTMKQKDTEKTIGEITILCNGKIYYIIPSIYSNQNYIKEVLLKFKDIIKRRELSLEIGKTNLSDQQMANELGFIPTEDSLEGIRTYKFIKES